VVVLQSYRPFNPLFDWVGVSETTFTNVITSPLRFSSSLINQDHLITSSDSVEGVDYDDPDGAT